MTEEVKQIIERFAAIGVEDADIVEELIRFRIVDQLISSNAEARQWGLSADKLYELAKEATQDVCGPIPYDQTAFETVYGPSFQVDLADMLDQTGYITDVAGGKQWTVPLTKLIEDHKQTEGIVLFAGVEEYLGLVDTILQALPSERLILQTASESCYVLLKKLYPLAPVTMEWPEDVIFDHIVFASNALFRPPVQIMEELGNRITNVTEQGTVHCFIPLAAIQDQLGMNKMAVQYMLTQPTLTAVNEWAPIGAYEFIFTPAKPQKVALAICEVNEDGKDYRTTPFIALPHEVLSVMNAFSIMQYALSLCGVKPDVSAQNPCMGEDGFYTNDPRTPLYMRAIFDAYESERLVFSRQGQEIGVRFVHHEGLPADKKLSEEEFQKIVRAYKASSAEEQSYYWEFTEPVAAYVWYTYLTSERGRQIVQTLSTMVLSTEAFLQLLGSCRRVAIKGDDLQAFLTTFVDQQTKYEARLKEANDDWKATLDRLSQAILPAHTEE